eukprot:4024930-Amphidinium_carterae.1
MLLDESFAMTSNDIDALCQEDCVYASYQMFAPMWANVVKEHLLQHELSSFHRGAEGTQLIWIHSSRNFLKQKLTELSNEQQEANLDPCYSFSSPVQAVIHKLVHCLYGLSDEAVNNDTVAICMEVTDNFMEKYSRKCRNG